MACIVCKYRAGLERSVGVLLWVERCGPSWTARSETETEGVVGGKEDEDGEKEEGEGRGDWGKPGDRGEGRGDLGSSGLSLNFERKGEESFERDLSFGWVFVSVEMDSRMAAQYQQWHSA